MDNHSRTAFRLDRPITDHLCVGIDLHKDTLTACWIDPTSGEASFRRIACKCRNRVADFFTDLKQRGPIIVAIEAVGFYRWLWDLLTPIADHLVLADATQCRAMAGRRFKTDREDALNVAQLLAAGRLPVAYAPSVEVYQLKDATRHRNFLARSHARCQHRVRSLMNINNRPGPKDLSSDSLARYLKAQTPILPEHHVAQLWGAVDLMSLLERQITTAEYQTRLRLKRPCFAHVNEMLQSIKGVGPVTAATVIAEVGDLRRFESAKAIVNYAGLDPRVYASGHTQRTGHISKTGPSDLRWILQEAAWGAIRWEPRAGKVYRRVVKRAGKKRAAVAVARHLLVWMWAMVKHDEPFRHHVPERKAA